MTLKKPRHLGWVALYCCLGGWILGAQPTAYQRAKDAIMSGQWDEALSVTAQLLKANPRDVNALNLKGLALTGRGDLPQADEAFEEALRIAPSFATPERTWPSINLP